MLYSHSSNPLPHWGSFGALQNPYTNWLQSPHLRIHAQAFEDKMDRQPLENTQVSGNESGVLNQVRFVYITF